MVNVVDAFKVGIFHQGNGIKSWHHLALFFEGRFECAKALHIRCGTHVFIMVQNGQTVYIAHGDNGFFKTVVIPCGFGATLAFHGHFIGHIAGEPVFGGDDVCTNPLGDEIVVKGEAGVNATAPPSDIMGTRLMLSTPPAM